MWVADINIPAPDFKIDALRQRLNHPVLGYTFCDTQYHNAIAWWNKHRHGWGIDAAWIDFFSRGGFGVKPCH
ncbi:MAG TPA: hypothetical protein ENN49_11275 [Bacteroidales bacterium]|nr:hypothetical protein [Bacteroidales bacterium]